MTNQTNQPRLTPDPAGRFILHLPDVTHIDTQVWSVDIGLTDAGLTALRALLTGQAPATDRAALRDRIAAAIWERQNPGRRWVDCEHRWRADAEEDADAVLAVLPPTDRAAVLRDAADRIDRMDLPQDDVDMFDNGARWATKLLRRMAAEAQPSEPLTVDRATVDRALDALRAGNHITARLLLESALSPTAGAQQDGAQP
jgi:hypothetical protein